MNSEDRYSDEPSRPERAEEFPTTTLTKDDKLWGMLAHLSGLLASFVGFSFLGPLIVWLIKKDQSPFVDDQGKEALNFQINLLGHVAILVVIGIATCGIGFLLFIPWGVYALVMPIIAGVKANNGERYRYPVTLRLIQ